MSTVVPMLAYEDGPAAIDWLVQAFGFAEESRIVDSSGRIGHAELRLGDGSIFLATPTPDYESPRHHREHCTAAATWSRVPYVIDGVCVQVDDVDAHFERAKAAGAGILSEPADQPGIGIRHYRVEDLEGHRWMFEGPMRDAR